MGKAVIANLSGSSRAVGTAYPLDVTILDGSGNPIVTFGSGGGSATPAATATLSNVAASASSVTVLASNASRLGFVLYNDSTVPVNVKLGATASATSFTKRMLPNEQWDTNDLGVNYTGKIDAIWDSATGTMRVTELSA